mmetsp:Transcript_12643/g.30852  ORF Transcript_12643/g.30852 Transcript_12643/m.30852 type:complete len:93 (+) Transcript_12643:1-279(+)
MAMKTNLHNIINTTDSWYFVQHLYINNVIPSFPYHKAHKHQVKHAIRDKRERDISSRGRSTKIRDFYHLAELTLESSLTTVLPDVLPAASVR